jgi:hypothetical protein
MRRNLLAKRERQIARELREELAGLGFGEGRWASLYARMTTMPLSKRFATREELAKLDDRRRLIGRPRA